MNLNLEHSFKATTIFVRNILETIDHERRKENAT